MPSMPIKFILALGLVTAAPIVATTTNWVLVSESDSGSNIYIDRNSIKKTGPTIQYWTRSNYKNNKNGWKQDITLVEANCSTGQRRFIQIVVYYVDGTSDSTSSPSVWKYVVPETVAKTEFDYACSAV